MLPLKASQGNEDNKDIKYFRLVMSNKESVCQHVDKLINGNATVGGVIHYGEIPEFNAIVWRDKIFKILVSEYREVRGFMSISNVDIDNDGVIETIANQWTSLSGYPGNSIYIFKKKPIKFLESSEVEASEIRKFSGVLFSTDNPYKLSFENAKPASMKYYFERNDSIYLSVINILHYDKRYYLVFDQSIKSKDSPYWIIVAEVENQQFQISKDDKRMANKLKYICYFDGNRKQKY